MLKYIETKIKNIMDFTTILNTSIEKVKVYSLYAWEFTKNNPKGAALIVLVVILTPYIFMWILRLLVQLNQSHKLIFLKVTLSRDESQKDKEKVTEKDFREKIAIMSQLYRSLHETTELNLWNSIRVKILKHNIFSFELVAHNKNLEFYITTPEYYQDIVGKQVTSYYPNANIEPVEPYEIKKPGEKVKGHFAFTEKKFWFPIKTYKNVENDPLNSLSNIFSNMAEDEICVIQTVIRPRNDKWTKKSVEFGEAFFKGKKIESGWRIPLLSPILNVFKGIFLGFDKMTIEKNDAAGGGYVRMLQAKEEVAKRIGEKAGQTGFDCVIRLLATAKTERRAEELSNSMVLGLGLFKDTSANNFQTRRIIFIDFVNDELFLFNFKHRLLDCRVLFFGEKKSLLAEEELASLYHFPSSIYNQSPIIKWMDYKVLPAPLDTPTEGILIGYNLYRGQKKEIHFKKNDRSRHHYIIGKSGSGKSVLLSYMARQDILNGEGVCIIDPHGDLIEDALSYIPKERAKDVIIFDPSDTERPMGLNILEAKTPPEMDLVASQATEIFIKLFGDEIFGPRIQHYFRNACLTLCEDMEEGATLIDVPRMFTDDAFMRYKVKKIKNPVVKSFWQNEYANTGERERQEMIPYFSAKFGPFITNTIMRNTIGQKNSSFDFRKVMDEGKILLVKLSKGKIGDLNTQLLGLVMVARIQMAAMSRADMEESKRRDFFLYVDEFQNFATDSFCSILSEARKYRLNLIMAHQYINQLVVSKFGSSSTQIRDAVFGNVGTLCSFKVGAEDAEYLAKEYAPLLSEQDVIGISNYKMYIKLNINNTTSRPFSCNTIWDQIGQNKKVGEIVREYSRLKHARKKYFVEQEITARIGIDINDAAVDTSKLPMGQAATAASQAAAPAVPAMPATPVGMPQVPEVPVTPNPAPPQTPQATTTQSQQPTTPTPAS